MDTGNRRLIRPNLNAAKEPVGPRRNLKPKSSPPDQTNAESFVQWGSDFPLLIAHALKGRNGTCEGRKSTGREQRRARLRS